MDLMRVKVAENKQDLSDTQREVLLKLARHHRVGYELTDKMEIDGNEVEPQYFDGMTTGSDFINALVRNDATPDSISKAALATDLNAVYLVYNQNHRNAYESFKEDLTDLARGKTNVRIREVLEGIKDVSKAGYDIWSPESQSFRRTKSEPERGMAIETKDNPAAAWFLGERLKEMGASYKISGTSVRMNDDDMARMFAEYKAPANNEQVVSQAENSRAKIEEPEQGVTLFSMLIASQTVVAQFDDEGRVTGFKTATKETKSDDFKATRDAIIADTSLAKQYQQEVESKAYQMIETMNAQYGETKIKDAEFMIDYAKDLNVNIYTGPEDRAKSLSKGRLTSSITAKMSEIVAAEKARQIAYFEARERELRIRVEETKKVKDEEERKRREAQAKQEEEQIKEEQKKTNAILMATTAAIALSMLKGGTLDKIMAAKTVDECAKTAELEAVEAKNMRESVLNPEKKEPHREAPAKNAKAKEDTIII